MKKELHPGIVAAIVVVALVLVGWFGYQKMKPSPYDPSPGGGVGIVESENSAASVPPSSGNSPGEQQYLQSMQGGSSTPGVPAGAAVGGDGTSQVR